MDKKKKNFIVTTIIVSVILLIGVTVAFFGWEGEESSISLTVTSGTGSCIKTEDNNISLEPVSSKEDGRIIKLLAKQEMVASAYITWNMTINTINELLNESFKYELINTTTGVSYGSGNFGDITEENNTISFSSSESIANKVDYEFALYLWIDGSTFNNPISMAGKGLDFDITCSISNSIITLDNDEADVPGTTILYFKDNTAYLDQTLTQALSTTENPITVPEKTGYAFDGYYAKVAETETQVINTEGYITENFLSAIEEETINIYAKWTINNYIVTYNYQNNIYD